MTIDNQSTFIIFIIFITLFLTIIISSFWFSLCYIAKYKMKKGLLYLLFIVSLFIIAVLNYHIYMVTDINQGLFYQVILLIPAILLFNKLLKLRHFSERKYNTFISVSFLSAIILIMQPLVYLSWLKLSNFIHNIWLERAQRKIEYIISSEKEILLEKIQYISLDQEFISIIEQKDIEKLHNYVDQKQNEDNIDIIQIQVPGLETIDTSEYEYNQSSILGVSDATPQIILKPIESEFFNLVTSRYILSAEGNEIALVTIGTTLDKDYFEALKSSFMCEFLVINDYGIYYKTNSEILLPNKINLNNLENYHYKTIESQNTPNLFLILPIDSESAQNGSILFETITPAYVDLVKFVAIAQFILSLNIVFILFVLDKELKTKKKTK